MTEANCLPRSAVSWVLGLCCGGLTLAFLPSAAASNIDDISSVDAALVLIERFETVCGPQVEQGKFADKSDLVALNTDQIVSMSAALGYSGPAAIWSDQDATWYQIQHSIEKPETCEFVSFRVTLEDMLAAWDIQFRSNAKWQSFSGWSVEDAALTDGQGTGYFAFRRYDGQVVVIGVAGVQLVETGYVTLRYQKTTVSTGDKTSEEDG